MIFSKIIEWIQGMFKRTGQDNNIPLSSDMIDAVTIWSDMYSNKASWVDNKKTHSMGLPSSIASEVARLVTLELKTEITGSVRADLLNETYKKACENLRKQVEYGCAKGGFILKPYVSSDSLKFEFIQADEFCPVSFDSTNIIKCVFANRLIKGKYFYTRLETHELINGTLIIRNEASVSTNADRLGSPIELSSVPEWKDIKAEETIQGIDKMLFGYFRVPLANTVDTKSLVGVSVYSNAVDLIRKADEMYSNCLWEYKAKQAAVHISSAALKIDSGTGKQVYPGGIEELYRVVEFDTGAVSKPYLDIYSPEIRDSSLFNGLNQQLRRIEFACSLAYGTLSDPNETDKTAEEIRASKQRSYSAVNDMQMALQRCLGDFADAMDFWCTYHRLAPVGAYDASFTWDDSLVVDSEQERATDRADVSMGVMRHEEYRAKWYGETIDQALKNLPKMEQVID